MTFNLPFGVVDEHRGTAEKRRRARRGYGLRRNGQLLDGNWRRAAPPLGRRKSVPTSWYASGHESPPFLASTCCPSACRGMRDGAGGADCAAAAGAGTPAAGRLRRGGEGEPLLAQETTVLGGKLRRPACC